MRIKYAHPICYGVPIPWTQTGLRTIDIGSEHGPEHIAIGSDGKLYAAMTSGNKSA